MASKLGLYNAALLHLGQGPLGALTDEGSARRKLDAAYDDIAKWCLEQGFWNHAIRTVELYNDDDSATLFGYSFVYSKPTDWVRTCALSADEYLRLPLLNYKDADGYWYADIEPIYLEYISNDASYGMNLGSWPQTYTTFVEYALAHKVCKAVTGSSEGSENLYKLMIRAKRDAANKDGMNEPVTKFPPTGRLIGSRGTSFGREGRYRAG